MKGRREKEWKRGQLRTYDPLDFSRFTASENAAGGFFQQTLLTCLPLYTMTWAIHFDSVHIPFGENEARTSSMDNSVTPQR
jgi:hypothetical protein